MSDAEGRIYRQGDDNPGTISTQISRLTVYGPSRE